jgi:hypothetical protein
MIYTNFNSTSLPFNAMVSPSGRQSTRQAGPLNHRPTLQQPKFGGPDVGSYFNFLVKLSVAFWAGLAAAGVGFPLASQLKHTDAVMQVEQMNTQTEFSEAKIKASLKQLQSLPESERPQAMEAHQRVVTQEVLKQLEMVTSGVEQFSVAPAVKNALAESQLSTEEQNEVVSLLLANESGDILSPQDAFNQFADKILSKHTDSETVAQAKQSMQSLLSQENNARFYGNLALGVAILGALLSAGLLGLGASTTGLSGAGAMMAWAPVAAFAGLINLLKRKKSE